jgi:Uma2 family endonuclease
MGMAVKTLLSEAEYLRMSFPGVDQEFEDGELIERATPDTLHSAIQYQLGILFYLLRATGIHFFVYPELRHRIGAERYLIPDLAVHYPTNRKKGCPLHHR